MCASRRSRLAASGTVNGSTRCPSRPLHLSIGHRHINSVQDNEVYVRRADVGFYSAPGMFNHVPMASPRTWTAPELVISPKIFGQWAVNDQPSPRSVERRHPVPLIFGVLINIFKTRWSLAAGLSITAVFCMFCAIGAMLSISRMAVGMWV